MKNNSYVSDEIALLLKDNSINIKSEREIAWIEVVIFITIIYLLLNN